MDRPGAAKEILTAIEHALFESDADAVQLKQTLDRVGPAFQNLLVYKVSFSK